MIPGRAGNTPAPNEAERLVLHCVANGADAIFHFRWRACPFGAEQSHGTLTDYDGRPKRIYTEIQRAFSRLSRLDDLFRGTSVVSQAAVIHDFPTWWLMDTGVNWNGPRGMYLDHAKNVFMALKKQQINVDVINREADFSAYKLIVAPVLSPVDDALAEKLLAFVRAGGTLLWHPLGAIKDSDARIYPDRIHPLLRRELGIDVTEFATLGEGEHASFTWDGKAYPARLFCDLPTLETAAPLAYYSSNWFAGTPALTETKIGSGRWIYLATFAGEDFYQDFFRSLLPQAGVKPPLTVRLPGGIEMTERSAADGRRLVFLINTLARPQTFSLPAARDVYHEEDLHGTVLMPPHGVRILKL
jgi:beta-galactosidase